METATFVLAVLIIAALVIGSLWWDGRRKQKRKDSLRHDRNTGMYIWTDFDGTERKSREDPSKRDGLWDQEAATADADGGDGGGGD